jgi:hypothetical protein
MMTDREEDQQRAMEIAGPILPGLYSVLNDAVAFYFSDAYSDRARAEHTSTAVANNIYSHAEKRVLLLVEQTPGLSIIDIRALRVANYLDQGLFRFKRVRANGRHSNYQTRQQQDYDDQLTLPDLPEPAVRMTVGYELDGAESTLKRIMIARPIGRSIFWTAQVIVDAGVASWADITPRRFGLTEGSDFDAARARGRRGSG